MPLGIPSGPIPDFAGSIESAKKWFFREDLILRLADKARARALSKAGAFIRRSAKSSIRKRKAASQPGSPPSSHTGLLRDNIFFAYEPSRGGTVVVGPTAMNWVHFQDGRRAASGIIPQILEYGGSYQRAEEWTGSGWRRIDMRRRGSTADVQTLLRADKTNVFRGRPIRLRTVTIAARPYMRPALAANLGKFADLFRGSIGRAAA